MTAEATRPPASPSDSILMTLARAAMATEAGHEPTWPSLDLDDAHQREFGDYELLQEVGRGGMGVVYRARQRSLDRDVAIKFIASGLADSFNVARFLGEARAAARLMHPNIVAVHEVGSIDGVHYFSMPLVRGHTLASELDGGRMPALKATTLLLKLCEAIHYAHRLGLLHLDLKPANVLIDERGEPLITDFGLARHMDEHGGVDVQEVSGTPSFMAPEQILIKQYRLTAATDIYALGAILYRCLVGISPHGEGPPDELIRRAAAGRVRSPREIDPALSPDLAAICMKCLELQPRDRYASVAEIADDLRRVRDGAPVSVRRIGRIERAQRWLRREPKFATALGAIVLALCAGGLATLWQWHAATAAQMLAEQQRDRANVAMELGAYLFANGQKAENAKKIGTEDLTVLSAGLIAKLRERLPYDEGAQADTLTTLTKLLDEYDQYYAEQLLGAIAMELGTGYRSDVINALLQGQSPHRYMHAAILAWGNEFRESEPRLLRSMVAQALANGGDDPTVLRTVADFCPDTTATKDCLAPEAGRRLTELEPDNLYHWFLRFVQTEPGPQQAVVMKQAAQHNRFDDHQIELYLEHRDTVLATGVKAPALVARPWAYFSPEEPPDVTMASITATFMPTAARRRFNDYCSPTENPELTSETRAACLHIALAMARSTSSAHSRMIGVWVGRGLVEPGSAIDNELLEIRRQWIYCNEKMAMLAKGKQVADERELVELGEIAAFAKALERNGIPGSPPANWAPTNPELIAMTASHKAPAQSAPAATH